VGELEHLEREAFATGHDTRDWLVRVGFIIQTIWGVFIGFGEFLLDVTRSKHGNAQYTVVGISDLKQLDKSGRCEDIYITRG
jgi:hypothetical protein